MPCYYGRGQKIQAGMMWARYLSIGFIIFGLTVSIPKLSYSEGQKSILIIYEGKTRLGENFPILETLELYLRHFNVSIKSSYTEKIDNPVSNYDCVIYLGLQERKISEDLLRELSKVKNLIWIEANIKQYAEYMGWKDFEDYGYNSGYTSIIYKDKSINFQLDTPVYIGYPKTRRDLSFLYDSKRNIPWVWTKGNIWYFGRLDFRDNSFLVFFDLLHNILKEEHRENRRILLLIDEVNPLTSAEKLRELLLSHCCEEAPINLVIYPEVTRSRDTYYIEDNRELLEVLKLVDEHNGSIIMGSYPNTRDIEEKVDRDLTGLARIGVFPIAFKLPYSDVEKYHRVSRYFRLILYNGLISIRSPKNVWYPVNMDRFNPDNPEDYIYLLEKAKDFMILRDVILGIAFPSYAPVENLRRLIYDIRSLGYEFLNLTEEPFYVESPYVKVMKVGGEKIIINNVPPLEKTFLQKAFEVFISYLRLILITVISIFAVLIFYLIKNRRRLYERGG